MGNIPSNRNDLLTFAQSHMEIWQANRTALGLSTQICAAVVSAVQAAVSAQQAVEEARNASRTATQNLSDSFAALRLATSDAVRNINTYAANQLEANRAAVYNTA